MVKCIGICSKCGKCKNAALMSSSDDRKAKSMLLPDDFQPEAGGHGYGIAFDIGTTTVVGMLWDLSTGKYIASSASANAQAQYGADVISRITYCGHDGENLAQLTSCIHECMNGIIYKLQEKHEFNTAEVMRVNVCGNTTMSHIFAGYQVMNLALAPFEPSYTGTLQLKGSDTELDISPEAEVTVIPNIAGHVGGDIVAGMVASRIRDKKGLTIFIDIGTNGEIVLSDNGMMYACSTAAGPAFEGASIECGMRAADGAIEKVLISNGSVYFRTIGERPATGICGSGIIDAAAQMLTNGLINSKGRMTGDSKELILAEGEGGNPVKITQKDIREIQLAKGAISSGMQILLKEAGRTVEEIDEIIIAGAFGSYIDIDSAINIGLLPKVKKDIIKCLGNTAGSGVSMTMMSSDEMKEAELIPGKVKHIELSDRDDFMDIYMESLGF